MGVFAVVAFSALALWVAGKAPTGTDPSKDTSRKPGPGNASQLTRKRCEFGDTWYENTKGTTHIPQAKWDQLTCEQKNEIAAVPGIGAQVVALEILLKKAGRTQVGDGQITVAGIHLGQW